MTVRPLKFYNLMVTLEQVNRRIFARRNDHRGNWIARMVFQVQYGQSMKDQAAQSCSLEGLSRPLPAVLTSLFHHHLSAPKWLGALPLSVSP